MSFKKFRASPDKALSNEEEEHKINEIRKLIGPVANKFPSQCSDASILRFLQARNWSTRKAGKLLKENLKWRQEFKPENIQWEDVAQEAETGKIYIANYLDRHGRTVLVMKPGLENSNSEDKQIKYLVYCMEKAILNQSDQEQMVWLIDFHGWNMGSVSMKLTRETARVLQDRYPERLGVAILYNPPKVFESFWMLVKPFLEHKTYKKVKFVYSDQPQTTKMMEDLFDKDKLEAVFGGQSTETFDYDAYSKRMKDEDQQKRDVSSSDQSLPFDPTSEMQQPDLLLKSGSEVSDECDPSLHNYDASSELESLGKMESLHMSSETENDYGGEEDDSKN